MLIHLLGFLIMIGRLLPVIVATLAVLNFILAILSLGTWNNPIWGVINTILSILGFVFLGQLAARRKCEDISVDMLPDAQNKIMLSKG